MLHPHLASIALTAAISASMALIGCSNASSPTSAPPPVASTSPSPSHPLATTHVSGGTALPGGTLSDGLLQESALGIWNLHVDPATPTAHVTPQAMRSAQQNDDVYELPLDNLVNPGSFEIQSITVDGDSVDITWQFTHPFAAPANIDAPAPPPIERTSASPGACSSLRMWRVRRAIPFMKVSRGTTRWS